MPEDSKPVQQQSDPARMPSGHVLPGRATLVENHLSGHIDDLLLAMRQLQQMPQRQGDRP